MPKSDVSNDSAEKIERDLNRHNKEVEVRRPATFSNTDLATINSFADLEKALAGRDDVAIVDASEFGTGYTLLKEEEKRRLVGVKFAMLDYKIVPDGDFGTFVALTVLTAAGDKFIVIDGSTGIKDQIVNEIDPGNGGKPAVIMFAKGLRASDYSYYDEKLEKDVPATTFYLNYEPAA